MNNSARKKMEYDHRLRDYVRNTKDISIAVSLGVPKSTIYGWLRRPDHEVVSHEVFDSDDLKVRRKILRLERRLQVVTAIMLLLLVLTRTFRCRIDYQRLPAGKDKKRLINAIDRARKVIPLRSILCILTLSATRYHAWTRAKVYDCPLDDLTSCIFRLLDGTKAYLQAVIDQRVVLCPRSTLISLEEYDLPQWRIQEYFATETRELIP